MQKFLEIPKMNFNGQPNMFFGKIISCTCDLHLILDILNPLNMLNLYKTFLVMQRLYDGTFMCVDMVHPKSHRPRFKQKKKFIFCSWKIIWSSIITLLKVFFYTLIVHGNLNLGLVTEIRAWQGSKWVTRSPRHGVNLNTHALWKGGVWECKNEAPETHNCTFTLEA